MTTKKRIAILIPTLAVGGAERVVSILLKYLQPIYTVHLVLWHDMIEFPLPDGVKVTILPKKTIKYVQILFYFYSYQKFLKENEIDVSISFMQPSNFINASVRLLKVKWSGCIIINERNYASKRFSPKRIKGRVFRYLIKSLYPIADSIIVNSKCQKYDLHRTFKVPRHKMNLAYNPIHSDAFEVHDPVCLVDHPFIFIHVGRIEKIKNQKLLIDAFELLNQPNTELWLIGDGSLKGSMMQYSTRLRNNGKVKFLGYQSNPFKFMHQADCFVMSSDSEGLPNAMLEALASALPIISTDCFSGPREILAPETDFTYLLEDTIELAEYGILTPVGDVQNYKMAMEIILKNDDLRNRYKQQASERAKYFSLEKAIATYKNIIDKRIISGIS